MTEPPRKFSQMALRWVLDRNQVSVVIPGATRIEQVLENVRASDATPLSEGLHQKFRNFYIDQVQGVIRGKY